MTHDQLVQSIVATGAPLVRSVRLWDIYKPANAAAGTDVVAGTRSLTLRLELLDDTVTLTDERIDAVMAGVLAALMQHFGARLRA